MARRSRQSASRSGVTTDYSGRWRLAVVTTSGSTPDVRSERRRALAYARLAELREGVWMRPDNLAGPLTTSTGLDGDVEFMSARPSDARQLAARLWDLEVWSRRSFALLDRLAALPPVGPDELAPGFSLSAAVLRHLQADPLLPEELEPPAWPGRQLRADYDEWDVRYRSILAEWSRATGPRNLRVVVVEERDRIRCRSGGVRLGDPGFVHLGVVPAQGDQLVVRPQLQQSPVADHHDAIGPHGRRQPVGDQHRRP